MERCYSLLALKLPRLCSFNLFNNRKEKSNYSGETWLLFLLTRPARNCSCRLLYSASQKVSRTDIPADEDSNRNALPRHQREKLLRCLLQCGIPRKKDDLCFDNSICRQLRWWTYYRFGCYLTADLQRLPDLCQTARYISWQPNRACERNPPDLLLLRYDGMSEHRRTRAPVFRCLAQHHRNRISPPAVRWISCQ